MTVISSAEKRVEFMIETLEQAKVNRADPQELITSEPMHDNCVDDGQRQSQENTGKVQGGGLLGVDRKLASRGKSDLNLVRCYRT